MFTITVGCRATLRAMQQRLAGEVNPRPILKAHQVPAPHAYAPTEILDLAIFKKTAQMSS